MNREARRPLPLERRALFGAAAAGLLGAAVGCSRAADPSTPASGASTGPGAQATPAGDLPARALTDLAYAAPLGAAHLLNLFLPAGAGPFPLVIMTCGSGFMVDDTRIGSPPLPASLAGGDPRVTGVGGGGTTPELLASRWIQRGVAVAGVNVRSSSRGHFPDQVHDIKAAIRFLRSRAATYRLDPGRFATIGNSSGAWVAVMAAVTGDVASLEGDLGHADQSSAVQACIDLFGPTDFLQLGAAHDAATSPESQLMGFALTARPRRTEQANPCRYVTRASVPILITHGLADPLIPHQQSELLFEAYHRAGAEATLCLVPRAGHGDGYLASARLSAGRTVRSTRNGHVTTGSEPAPTYDSMLRFLKQAWA